MKLAISMNRLNNMMFALMLIVLSYIASYMGFPKFILRFLQFGSVGFLTFSILFRPKGNLYNYRYPHSLFYRLLLLLSIIIMIRGILDYGINYNTFVSFISSPKLFMVYLFPFILGCSPFTINYKIFYRYCSILTVLIAFIILINLQELVRISMIRATDISFESDSINISGLIALTSIPLVLFLQRDILPSKIWRLSLLNLLLLLFVSLLNARRSSTFGVFLVIFLGFLREKKLRWISVIALVFLVVIMYNSGLLDFLLARGTMDTRSIVVNNFYDDMDLNSWIFGRGATGTYFDPGFVNMDNQGIRSEIETGYLDLILKGGIFYLVTYVICLGYAAYLGWRHCKNSLCRSFSIIIFISLIELIPYGIPTWNFKYFSIWLGVAICMNPQLRVMTNEEIKTYFNLR